MEKGERYIHIKSMNPYTLITDNFMFKDNGEWRRGLCLYKTEYNNPDGEYFARTREDFENNFILSDDWCRFIYKGYREYEPTADEIAKINEMLGHECGNDYVFHINGNGNIFVSTNPNTWLCLAGREWIIDFENKVWKLIRMN